MTGNEQFRHFDYLFLGMGAGNALLLLQLHEKGLLTGKHIGVVEPDPKRSNDRTFCFWAGDEEINRYHLGPLISKTWNFCKAGGNSAQSIAPFRYHHVSGIDLYEAARRCLDCYSHEWISEAYRGNGEVPLMIGGAEISATRVFDSRPPVYQVLRSHESYLHQSFLGWLITCEQPVFNPDCFVMMDFSIPQSGHTQFMYVLPFDEKHAMVECTRFGTDPISDAEAENLLRSYISEHFGSFSITGVERGNIPMCSGRIAEIQQPLHWTNTGARAGNLKPSTGYSFMNSCAHAEAIAMQKAASQKSSRYAFYDRLLLKLLQQQPAQGKRIFEQLFHRIPIRKVLQFLREDISLWQELTILASLPKRLFIGAAIRDIWSRLSAVSLLPWLLCIVLLMLQALDMESWGYGLLLAGLLLIGLPHGAIDHLLETGHLHTPIRPLFVSKYLGASALMGLLWYLHPVLGLWVFLGYSAWHFGETEFRHRGESPGWLSLIWGSALLGLILFTHIPELNRVLAELAVPGIAESYRFPAWLCGFVLVLLSLHRPLSALYFIPALFLPLLQMFGLFFIADHSVKSSVHLLRGFQSGKRQLYLKALPFTFGAVLLGILFFYGPFGNTVGATGLFFVFLSCLSFPHVLAMNRFYRKQFRRQERIKP